MRLKELPTNIDKIRIVKIEKTIKETPTVKTLIFKDILSFNANPGEFLMVWIPGIDELPMSIMVYPQNGYAAITIRRHGIGSTSLFNKKSNDVIGIRGPYGNQFKVYQNTKNLLLIGGGTGLVPLLRLISVLKNFHIRKCTLIIGAKTKKEVFFHNIAKSYLSNIPHKIYVTTEDGTYRYKGNTVSLAKKLIDKEKFDMIYTCGPELMMANIFKLSLLHSIPIQASLERYMKCGIGICGSCCIGDKLVCKDGTVFNSTQLSLFSDEFGICYRDKSGKKSVY